jgi:hypothetical protein
MILEDTSNSSAILWQFGCRSCRSFSWMRSIRARGGDAKGELYARELWKPLDSHCPSR